MKDTTNAKTVDYLKIPYNVYLVEYLFYFVQLAKLFWDFGGILGLWLGCSVLSIVELIELALDALVLLCCKLTHRNHTVLPSNSQNRDALKVNRSGLELDEINL